MEERHYGDYAENSSDFVIKERNIPRNWYNYLWNDNYVTFVSQTGAGEGFLQDDRGRRLMLLKERGFFISENGTSHGICGLPVNEAVDSFTCTHSHGATVIETEKDKLASSLCFIVPNNEPCELCMVTVSNRSDTVRSFSLLAFCGTGFDDTYTRQGYNTGVAHFDKECNAVVIPKRSAFGGKPGNVFGFMSMSQPVSGYDCTYNAIVGPYGSFAHPVIAERGCCTSTDGCGEKLAFALEKKLTLKPGEKTSIVITYGIAFSKEEMKALCGRFASEESFDSEKQAVLKKFADDISGVSVDTPDCMLNKMFPWLKLQSDLGSRWARVRHNGFRDLTSDTDCFAAVNPSLAFERFKRILSYQYSNGYAPRTFIDGSIQDKKFADNTVWLTFTAMSILKELGDKTILDAEVPYNDGTVGTVYEHLYRSVDYLYNFQGLHGLIKIWGGDWNDCMNTAGVGGVGVSVWLSIAWYRANRMFAEIAGIMGKQDDVELCRVRGEDMRAKIEQYGWDGEYYIDAYNDSGEKIGSHECDEGKMFLIPQLWAVLSGVSTDGREIKAMDAVEKYLSSPLGTRISYPAYTHYDHGIGAVTLKPAGVHENGGVYLHTIAWKTAVDAILKRPEKVAEDIETILPFRNKVVAGRAEPYIMCNSYFGDQTGYRYGTPGQSWRTAAGQWFQKALVNYVFGLMPEMDGLRIDPCLPPEWKTCSIDKVFRGCKYHIEYENGGTHIKQILVNGSPISGNILPVLKGKADVKVITE